MDHINIMAYDYHGSWEATTGQNAPFKSRAGEDQALNVVRRHLETKNLS